MTVYLDNSATTRPGASVQALIRELAESRRMQDYIHFRRDRKRQSRTAGTYEDPEDSRKRADLFRGASRCFRVRGGAAADGTQRIGNPGPQRRNR